MIGADERLPCGVALEVLLIQVADNHPVEDPIHQNGCPYCQATLRSLRQGWDDVQAVVRQPVALPKGLTAKIMAQVRTLANYLAGSILLGHADGETRISHTVVGAIVQGIAARIPGVVFASAKLDSHDPAHPRRVTVALKLVVRFGPAIESVAYAVRQILWRRIPGLTGAELDRIDITISDITDPLDRYQFHHPR